MIDATLSVPVKTTKTLPFWHGQKTVDIRLELSDGTVDVIQMSVGFARAFAKAILMKCDK